MSEADNGKKVTGVDAIKPNKVTSSSIKSNNYWSNKSAKSSESNTTKKKFQGAIKGLEEHIFYYGKGMDSKYITTKEHVLNYIGKKYTASEEVSIEKNSVQLLGRKPPTKHTQTEYDALDLWEKESWKVDIKRYAEMKDTLEKNLTACYAIIWGQMSNTLRNQVCREATFKNIEDERDAPGLFNLIGLICNKTTTITHYPTRMLEALQLVLTLSGDKMNLADYYKYFVAKRKMGISAGLDFGTGGLQKHMLDQFVTETGHNASSQEYIDYNTTVSDTANEQFQAMIFMHNAGNRYEELRRDLRNSYTLGYDKMPRTVEDAYGILQMYETTPKNNPNKGNKKGPGGFDTDVKGKNFGQSFQQQDFR